MFCVIKVTLIEPVAGRFDTHTPRKGLGPSTVILEASEAVEMPREITTDSCKIDVNFEDVLHFTLLDDRQTSESDCVDPTLDKEVGLKLDKMIP